MAKISYDKRTSVTKLVDKLKKKVAWQRVPIEPTDQQYTEMVLDGIEQLLINVCQYDVDIESLIEYGPEVTEPDDTTEEGDDSDNTSSDDPGLSDSETGTDPADGEVDPTDDGESGSSDEMFVRLDLKLDERRYVILCAQIEFFKLAQEDVNNIVSYSTNAITIANADKPYKYIGETIDKLELERRKLWKRMYRHSLHYDF